MSETKSKTIRLRLSEKQKIRLKLSFDSTTDWKENFSKICARILETFELTVNETCNISVNDTTISDAEQLKEIIVNSSKKLIDIAVKIEQEQVKYTLVINVKETECEEDELVIKLNDISVSSDKCWNNIMNPIISTLGIDSIDAFFDKYLLLTQEHEEKIEELDDIVDYFEDTDTLHLIVKVTYFHLFCVFCFLLTIGDSVMFVFFVCLCLFCYVFYCKGCWWTKENVFDLF